MTALWRDIDPVPIEMVSPSAFNNLLSCRARVAFARSDETKGWLRGSMRAALGSVAHHLYEAAAHGNPTDQPIKQWLEVKWDEFMTEQDSALRKLWPGRPIPAPRAWPGYAMTKVRLIQRLSKTTGQAQLAAAPKPKTDSSPGSPPLPWIERTLRDEARGLFGTPDRVDRFDGALRVVDLKSGVKQAEVTASQTRQLILYAHLVEVELGELPSWGVIVDAKGTEASVPIERKAVMELLDQVSLSVQQFNAEVETGNVDAHPEPDACRWCPFRVECRAYWEARDASWPATGDLVGVVAKSLNSELRLRVLFPTDNLDQEVRLLNVGDEVDPDVGDVVFVVDTDSAGVKTLRMRWDSRMRVVPV